ncbi:hypothetical protein PR202_gb22911 [Eleusine coracana subsp. coracana]|uniref:NAC domain-containing protein n=1 Tax=Eleusine coracana subsp. coracana TaxID=191504 RepID=A0AAV5FHC9_ELECO|nr:hypothetical protein PR202_gb22911 [Eleusine coracana subsp. coracana]
MMERFRGGVLDASAMGDLPPGFRFHPTDEELISFYLLRKSLDSSFRGRAIAEIDLNKCEPWELPEKAAMGEREWYFYSLRDRKYPTGLRTNRATVAGYWKATGKDREIRAGPALVGMKKTLVFYRGRAPKGQKTHWVMHEYRLEGTYAYAHHPGSTRDEWVIARVFQKPGEVPSARSNKNRFVGLSSAGGGDASCFSDSTSASVGCGGGGGGASASSAPQRPLHLPDASLFAAADGESGCGSYLGYGGGGIAANAANSNNNNLVTGRELVPCFSTAMDATLLGIGQYNPAPLAVDPPASFFTNLRPLQDGTNSQLPPFLNSGGEAAAASSLGSGAAHHHWAPAGGMMMDVVKVEAGLGRAAPPQMAVGPGQLDGAYAWGF